MRVYQFRHIRAPTDSSRRTALRHAARQPPRRIGVIPIVNRVLALLCAIGLCCLASACGSRRAPGGARIGGRAEQRGHRHARVAARGGPHGRERPSRARRDRPGAGALRRPRCTTPSPAPAIRWRYRLVLNGAAVVVPQTRARPRSGRLPGVREVDAGATYTVGKVTSQRRRQGRRDLVDGSHEPGRRDQDRDHRRRRRPDPPVLRPRRLHDAARLPEGPGRVHDGEGDRRACIRPGRHRRGSTRASPSTPSSPGMRPTSPGSPPATPAPPPREASRSRASRRAPTSATTRRSASRPTRTSASTATRPRSSPRSRPRSRTAWT